MLAKRVPVKNNYYCNLSVKHEFFAGIKFHGSALWQYSEG
jgi:hypothetical protein